MDPILQKLIAIPSVCGDLTAAHEIISFSTEYLQARGMQVRQFVEKGFPSLVATTRRTTRPKVMLAAHLDVTPAPPELFTLRLEQGKYYGRGVFDMKFAAACYLQVVDALQHRLEEFDFGIMLTTDEELYGPYGTGMLVQKGFLPKVCVLPDGGTDWHIETLAKGRWFVEVAVRGTTAHGSRPWEGDSASLKLLNLLHEMQTLFTDAQQPHTHTMNVGVLKSGAMVNQVPDHAVASIDFRFVTQEDMQQIRERLTVLCERYDATITPLTDEAPPIVNSLENPYIAAFANCITEVTGIVPEGFFSYATSDARYFMQAGIPCVVTSPSGGSRHADTEWLDATSYEQFKPILLSYLQAIAAKSARKTH